MLFGIIVFILQYLVLKKGKQPSQKNKKITFRKCFTSVYWVRLAQIYIDTVPWSSLKERLQEILKSKRNEKFDRQYFQFFWTWYKGILLFIMHCLQFVAHFPKFLLTGRYFMHFSKRVCGGLISVTKFLKSSKYEAFKTSQNCILCFYW